MIPKKRERKTFKTTGARRGADVLMREKRITACEGREITKNERERERTRLKNFLVFLFKYNDFLIRKN